jgi:hypothetical protein
VVGLTSVAAAQVKQAPAAGGHLVAPADLVKVLPAVEGWTRGDVRSSEVDTASCAYTQVSASYARDDVRVKIVIADTGAHAGSIMAIASPIAIFPDDYAGTVPPATTIARLKIAGSPAVEMWDAEKLTGEVTVLAGGRFVVTAEAVKGDSLETLRGMLAAVDVKTLVALKQK